MRGKPGILVAIEGGGKAIAYHHEQEQAFKDLKKHFIHYIDDDYKPIMENGKPKTGLKASSKLRLLGYTD